MKPLVFHFPLPPNANRSGWGHWKAYKAKQAWYAAADLLLAAKKLPRPPKVPYDKCWLSAVLTMSRAMDDENAAFRANKFARDFLKRPGYIVDDSRKHCRIIGMPDQVITRTVPPGLCITLTPVKDWDLTA